MAESSVREHAAHSGLEVRGLTFGYPGSERPALSQVSCGFATGETHAILGPNGSGKSTLLRVLAGGLDGYVGQATYRGVSVGEWNRRSLARRMAVVPQFESTTFPLTVQESVEMGRYPHVGPWSALGSGDRDAVHRAMVRCEVAELSERSIHTLSGGERQRVRIARALAQEPETLLLDEPTASLDIRHEMAIFELLADLVSSHGVTVLLVTHHLNLAARYASSLLLLDDGEVVGRGTPNEVLTREAVEAVYGWPVEIRPHGGEGPDRGAPQIVPLAAVRDRGSDRA